MNNQNPPSTSAQLHPASHSAYTPPQLTLYGTVSALTKGGNGTSGEGGSPLPQKKP